MLYHDRVHCLVGDVTPIHHRPYWIAYSQKEAVKGEPELRLAGVII